MSISLAMSNSSAKEAFSTLTMFMQLAFSAASVGDEILIRKQENNKGLTDSFVLRATSDADQFTRVKR
jgi:hypothetical protein